MIGSNLSTYNKIKKYLKRIAKMQEIDISIKEINNEKDIRKYKVLQTPTLVINDEYKYNLEKIDFNILKRIVIFCS